MTSKADKLDALFPVPTPPPSPLSPARLPGVTYESGVTLAEVLKENHEKWHIFFNEKGFHNHTSHHLLAIYYLGAKSPLLRAAYESDKAIQRPIIKSPGSINEENFHEHLGDGNYWSAYLEFFSGIVLEKGATATIEKYIFSPQANVEEPAPGKPPMQMQSRFLGGLLHPLIHTGYGLEFGLLGMVAEGLAQTAVHKPEAPALVPDSLFQYVAAASADAAHATLSYITSLLPSLSLERAHGKAAKSSTGVHALTIVARILHDDRFTPKAIGLPVPADEGGEEALDLVVKSVGDVLVSWADTWTVNGTNADEVESKIEELVWTNVVLYGVGGWGGRKHSQTGKFNADFPLCVGHLPTLEPSVWHIADSVSNLRIDPPALIFHQLSRLVDFARATVPPHLGLLRLGHAHAHRARRAAREAERGRARVGGRLAQPIPAHLADHTHASRRPSQQAPARARALRRAVRHTAQRAIPPARGGAGPGRKAGRRGTPGWDVVCASGGPHCGQVGLDARGSGEPWLGFQRILRFLRS